MLNPTGICSDVTKCASLDTHPGDKYPYTSTGSSRDKVSSSLSPESTSPPLQCILTSDACHHEQSCCQLQVRERDLPFVMHTLAAEFTILRVVNGETVAADDLGITNGFVKPKLGKDQHGPGLPGGCTPSRESLPPTFLQRFGACLSCCKLNCLNTCLSLSQFNQGFV